MDLAARSEALRGQLQELYGLHCIPLWGTPRNLERKTYGYQAANIAKALGTPFMPWQRYVADVVLEVDPYTGLLAHRDVLLMVPRQSGKTTELLAVMIQRALQWRRQNILYAAQSRILAKKKWLKEHVEAIEDTPVLWRRVDNVRKANGEEGITWTNRSWHGITSNTEKAAHGETLDLGVIDEAFSHEDDRMEAAFSPAMLTRLQPQQWIVSTAGTAKSYFLNKKRELGRRIVESGEPSTMAVFDWTVDVAAGYDRTDPKVWWSCMPALGHTQTEAAVRAELLKMEPAEFDRAYLNVTKLDIVEDDPNVPSKEWPELVDPKSKRGAEVAFALDVTPDRQTASIAAYSVRADGLEHVELIDHREGTDWIVARARELVARHKPVALGLDIAGPAGSLLIDLEKEGLVRPEDPEKPEYGNLAIPTTREVAAACGAFTDACRQDQIRHRGNQDPLNIAVAGARTRPLGDAWAWARKSSSTDISPLVAVTLARWAYATRAHLVTTDYDVLDSVW